jgi:hypothetical protein
MKEWICRVIYFLNILIPVVLIAGCILIKKFI